MDNHDIAREPLDEAHVPDDEAITVPDLSKVFGDEEDDSDPFEPDVSASDARLPDENERDN